MNICHFLRSCTDMMGNTLSTREPDPGINEAVCSVIYSAPRTELKGATLSHINDTIHPGLMIEHN